MKRLKRPGENLLNPVKTQPFTFIPGVDDYSMYIQKSYIAYVFRHLSFPVDTGSSN